MFEEANVDCVDCSDSFLLFCESVDAGEGSESVDDGALSSSVILGVKVSWSTGSMGTMSPVKVGVRRTVRTPSDVTVITVLPEGNSSSGAPSSSPISSHVYWSAAWSKAVDNKKQLQLTVK